MFNEDSKCPTINITKLIFWLGKYCLILIHHTSMERFNINSAFRLCINLNFRKLTLMTGFEVQGHIYMYFNE